MGGLWVWAGAMGVSQVGGHAHYVDLVFVLGVGEVTVSREGRAGRRSCEGGERESELVCEIAKGFCGGEGDKCMSGLEVLVGGVLSPGASRSIS